MLAHRPLASAPITASPLRAYTLSALKGRVIITVSDATLDAFKGVRQRDPMDVTIGGGAVSFTSSRSISAETASVIINGHAVEFPGKKAMSAQPGNVVVNGRPTSFRMGYALTASAGSVTINGVAADLRRGRIMRAVSDRVLINGAGASFNYKRALHISASPAGITINVRPAFMSITHLGRYQISAFAGHVIVDGKDATIKFQRITAGCGSVIISGSSARLTYGFGQTVNVGKTIGGGHMSGASLVHASRSCEPIVGSMSGSSI